MKSMAVIKEPRPALVNQMLVDILHTLKEEPEFSGTHRPPFELDEDGLPAGRAGVANCSLDFDLWKDLRNPAVVGLHPAGLEEIWEYYACNMASALDPGGRRTMFRIPEPYETATKRYGRAVIVSVMVPVSRDLTSTYYKLIQEGSPSPLETFHQAMRDLNRLADQSVTRLAYRLMSPERVVLPMSGDVVSALGEQAIPATRRGDSHGPCKAVFPHKSVAVLTGLGQFGAHRLVMRDEIINGQVRRFLGPVRSLIMFDPDKPSTGAGLRLLTEDWKQRLIRLQMGAMPGYRLCQRFNPDAALRCSSCLDSCPTGAVSNSAIGPDGTYSEDVQKQSHRFWENHLQFDFQRCAENTSRPARIYGNWVCARCLVACAASGGRNRGSVERFTQEGAAV